MPSSSSEPDEIMAAMFPTSPAVSQRARRSRRRRSSCVRRLSCTLPACGKMGYRCSSHQAWSITLKFQHNSAWSLARGATMIARRLLLAVAVVGFASSAIADELPKVKVERQPLAAQARRVSEALALLGEPLTAAEHQALHNAAAAAEENQAVA